MKTYLKPFPVKLVIVLLLAVTVIIVHSCKKDQPEQVQKRAATATTDPNITLAQKWYDSAYAKKATTSASKQATQSVNKLSHDWSQKFKPYWANANVFMQSGMTFIELPAIENGEMGVAFNPLKDTTNINFGKLGTLTDLLIVKQQSGFSMYAMTIVADSSYLKGDYSKVANNSYAKMDTNFTGAVLFHRMDGTFVNGWRYQNGQVTRQLSPAPAGSTVIQSNGKLQVNVTSSPCSIIEVTTYWEDCTYSEATNYTVPYNCYIYTTTDDYQDCSGTETETGSSGGSPPPPCQVPSAGSYSSSGSSGGSPSDASIKGKLKVDVTTPPTGGSGGTTPPPTPPLQPCPTTTVTTPTTTQTITDSVTNPCLKGLIDRLTNDQTIQTDVATILRNTFGTSDLINITFDQAALTGSHINDDANTEGQNNSFTVTFNTPIIANASQEFLLETTMHEIFHAYLYVNPSLRQGFSQHAYMINNYVNTEVATLQQVFPNLSLHDAQCLVLGGYGALDPTTLNAAITSYGLTSNDVATTNSNYKAGTSGTHCQTN